MDSPLKVVAAHESQLMRDLSEVKREAQVVTEQARAEAAEILREAGMALSAELARVREEAASRRDAVRREIEAGAEQHARAARQEAMGRAGEARKAVLDLVLPHRDSEGGA